VAVESLDRSHHPTADVIDLIDMLDVSGSEMARAADAVEK